MKATVNFKTTLTAQDLFDFSRHFLLLLDQSKIESIEFKKTKMLVYDKHDGLLGEFKYNDNLEVNGTIRWYNQAAGEGMIRMHNGNSIHFFACNVVGADNHYHFLVKNVSFNEGDPVTFKFSADGYMVNELGALNVEKIGA